MEKLTTWFEQRSATLLLSLIMSMVGINAFAHDIEVANVDGKTIYYIFINNQTELAVSYRGDYFDSYSNRYTGSVVIPESVTYNGTTYVVTSIGDNAFRFCTGLTSVTIPNSVTSFGHGAFYGCIGLTSVTIPNSVTSIGDFAFFNCIGLTSITIPNSVTSINDSVFGDCSGLTSITIPNSVTSIGYYAFMDCTGLTSVTIPNSVTSINSYTFNNCSGLTSITIPNSVTSIGSFAFERCSGLTSITIPNSVTSIGYYAFYNCSGLTSVTIPNSVTSINSSAFSYCSGLTSITIPNSVTSINSSVFRGCSSLTSVTIPNSVTSIGDEAFRNCSSLTSVTIPNSVTSIGSSAFEYCSIKKIIWLTNTLPSSYYNIRGAVNYVANNQSGLSNTIVYPFLSSMFEVDGVKYVPVSPSERTCDAIDGVYDDNEKDVTIPSKVTYKGITMTVRNVQPYFCYGNKTIEHLQLEDVTGIGEQAFADCSSLQSVVIPSTVKTIGNNLLTNCGNLTSIVVGEGNTAYDSREGCNAIINTSTNELIEGCNNTVIPNTVTSIGKDAFLGRSGLTNIIIPESVKAIKENAFANCSALTGISIGNFVNSIGSYAFQNCSSMKQAQIGSGVIGSYAFVECSALNDLEIGEQVKNISAYAFQNCPLLTKISIPRSVTSIGNYAFQGCSGIKSVIIGDRDAELTLGNNGSSPLFNDCPLDSVYIGGNITYNTQSYYGYSPFYRNTSLRTVVISDKETEVSDYEFYGCTGLKSFKVGDGVTKFGDWAFSGCTSLESLSFGSQLQTIGREAFSDCASVTSIVSCAATPPTCGTQALDDINKWTCTLNVPLGCQLVYAAADQWKEFFFMQEMAVSVMLGKAMTTFASTESLDFTKPIDGLKAYVVSAVTDGKALLQEVTSAVPAGTGLILMGTAGQTYQIPYITGTAAEVTNKLVGVTTDTAIGGNGTDYILKDGKFVKATAGTLSSGKAYLKLDEAMAREFIVIDGETTGLGDIRRQGSSEERAVVYSLSGQRVSQPAQKGLYIVKGKKVVVK